MKQITCSYSDSDKSVVLSNKKGIEACIFLMFIAYTAIVILSHIMKAKGSDMGIRL